MSIISTKIPLLFISFSILFLISINQTSVESLPFKCTSTIKTCNAIVDYIIPNTTTINDVKNLFNVKNLSDILGVNNLPLSTSSSRTLKTKETIKIPFPCSCTNGTGRSDKVPVYTVVKDDGLFHIASDIFSGLVTFPEIVEANKIVDENNINVGEEFWIPLPCSCDEVVEGQSTVHYGYVVPPGSTVEGIAAEYNTAVDVLLKLNDLAGPNDLKGGAVLDVPLRACSSSISDGSPDYPLLVSNGTYALTAQDCVRCKCDAANNWTLQCEPSQFNSSIQQKCSPMQCPGSGSLYIGNSTSSGCGRATCSYTGYTLNGTILAALEQPQCNAPGNNPSGNNPSGNNPSGNNASKLNVWRMSFIVIVFHLMMFCIQFS